MKSSAYDVAVLGGGSAGYAAARSCSAAGLKTVLCEGGSEVGGLCILRGCMPTKALLQSAEVLHAVRRSPTFGIQASEVSADIREIIARKDRLIKEFADYRRSQLENGQFHFVRATAHFKDPNTLSLSNGEVLTAKSFIVATGSTHAPPPIPSLEEVGFLTSDEALFLERLPRSLIVLGGGAVAVEFAQFFSRLGVHVTLIQRSPQLLKDEDRDVAAVLETVFRREGLTVFTETNLVEAWREGPVKGVSFAYEGRIVRIAAEEIFYALGRMPNTTSLHLENAGVELSFGRFLVDSEMRTNVPHIFAAGDCTGLHEIVHVAIQQAEIAAHNIIHPNDRRHIDYRLLTSVVFTEPQIGRVGLTEKEALSRKVPFIAASYPFNDHGKSMIMEASDGFVKLLAHPQTGEILGGSCIGPHGGELIHEIIAAMSKRMTVGELASLPHYHPTLSEIWTYPAEELAASIAPAP